MVMDHLYKICIALAWDLRKRLYETKREAARAWVETQKIQDLGTRLRDQLTWSQTHGRWVTDERARYETYRRVIKMMRRGTWSTIG